MFSYLKKIHCYKAALDPIVPYNDKVNFRKFKLGYLHLGSTNDTPSDVLPPRFHSVEFKKCRSRRILCYLHIPHGNINVCEYSNNSMVTEEKQYC